MRYQNSTKLLLIVLLFSFCCLFCGQSSAEQFVVVGQPELNIQIEGKGDFEFKVVKVKDKRFHDGLVPMITKGEIIALYVGSRKIELIDGKIVDGFLTTKIFGKVRILGVDNPFYLWVTPKQKKSLMKLK